LKSHSSDGKRRDALVTEFLRYLGVERNASERTLRAYSGALTNIREHLQAKPWTKCTADDFRDYLFCLMKENAARSYIRLQFSALRTFYKFLIRNGVLVASPIKNLSLPQLAKRLPRFLTPQQMDDLLTHAADGFENTLNDAIVKGKAN